MSKPLHPFAAEDEINRLRAALERIDKFIDAVAPTKRSKEMASIQNEVRATLAGKSVTGVIAASTD